MKVFISADIEGCCGVFSNIETHKNEAVYAPFAKQMTKEVLAVCEAAHEAGADEIVVKDGHGDASNIDPLQMPSYVTADPREERTSLQYDVRPGSHL